MKVKNFMKYLKEGVLKYFKNFHEIVKYFKMKYFIVHPIGAILYRLLSSRLLIVKDSQTSSEKTCRIRSRSRLRSMPCWCKHFNA